jgi:hypothetical protein
MTMTNHKAKSLLRNGTPLILTLSPQGPSYSIDGRGTVAPKFARGLIEPRLLPGDLFLTPNEDGLFPGCSQTWQAK